MSRKDYVKFAELIKFADYLSLEAKKRLAVDLCNLFKGDNHAFNERKFIEACGIEV